MVHMKMKWFILSLYLFVPLVISARVGNFDDLVRTECKDGEIRSEDGQYCCPRPLNQEHTKYTCNSFDSSCWVICEPGYSFPDSQSSAQIIECVDGLWMTDGGYFSGDLCTRNVPTNESLVNSTSVSSVTSAGEYSDNGFNRTGRAMGGLDDINSPLCGRMPRIRNAIMKCSNEGDEDTWSCVATCIKDHVLPNGKPHIEYVYEDGAWRFKDSDQPVESIKSCFGSMASPSESDLYPPNLLIPDTDSGSSGQSGRCQGKRVPPGDTIGLIKVPSKLGICTNKEPLKGMVTCEGQCSSRAAYIPTQSGIQLTSSRCMCCQARQDTTEVVQLKCGEKNRSTKMKFAIPRECYCGPCTESQVMTTTEEPPITHIEGCPENHCN